MTTKQTYRVCCCFSRRFRLTVAEAPAEIKSLFDKYSENGTMTVDHLHRFLIEVQGEDKGTKVEEAETIIERLKQFKHLKIFHHKGLNLEAFFRYLFSDINTALSPTPRVHHDMNAPMSHYFIYTGHNSYLTGNQLSSDCSDVPIIKALQRGVRVIELDMWPNSSKDGVDILHGRTLTTPVELIKCLRSIKEYAFVASEYPVVLTLEDHLTPDLQAKVAEMVTQTFGDLLFFPESEFLEEFPSPESLKKKVIISTKPPKKYLENKSIKGKDNGSQKVKDSSEEEAWGKDVLDPKDQLESFDKNNLEDVELNDEEDIDDGDQKLQNNVAPEYKRLIAIHLVKEKIDLKERLRVDSNKVRRISLSEQKLEKAVITNGKDIVRFTQKNLLRVFPKSTRLDSSNYNPFIGWMHGAQMVAFNMQGHGRSLWMMQGMFRANGGCGYVKKPDFLMNVGTNNEMNSNRERGVERKWEDLGMDCLVSVFERLDIEDLILGVPFVCKSWYEASLNPTCWKSLDLFKPTFEVDSSSAAIIDDSSSASINDVVDAEAATIQENYRIRNFYVNDLQRERDVERKWPEDVGMDCFVSLFERLDIEDKILGMPLVCKYDYDPSVDSTYWDCLDSKPTFAYLFFVATFKERYHIQNFHVNGLLKLALNRGGNQVFKLLPPTTCSLDTLIYASDKCPCLKVLGLPENLYWWDDKEIKLLIGLVSKWKDLRCLGLGGIEYPHTKELLSEISCHCRNFVALWKRGLRVPEEAEAIANFLPSLKYLSLSAYSVTRHSLKIVLEGCRVLEHLLIKNCGFDDSEEVLKKMTSHVKNAKFVHVRYDYEHEDYWDYGLCSCQECQICVRRWLD